jgi:hypothetical protein
MKSKSSFKLSIQLDICGDKELPELSAHLFSASEKPVATAEVSNNKVNFELPEQYNGQQLKLAIAPKANQSGQSLSLKQITRNNGYVNRLTALKNRKAITISIPDYIIPIWCFCLVRGKLVTQKTTPDDQNIELPVCNARVHICEVDKFRFIIPTLPDDIVFRLRDDLIDLLKNPPTPIDPDIPDPIPDPPIPEPPIPTPSFARTANLSRENTNSFSSNLSLTNHSISQPVIQLQQAHSAAMIRQQLLDRSDLLRLFLCRLNYLWYFFRKDCLTTVETDDQGYFSAIIAYDCDDKPDIYIWAEQLQESGWQTIYKPSVACNTHWNYQCGDLLTINAPDAEGCEQPDYDIPEGVVLFVLPHSIGHAPIYGNTGSSAPRGWVRTDGMLDYHDTLGDINNAPFGGRLVFRQDDSYFIPNSGVKYYRYSFRRQGDSEWTPIQTPLARAYRMEYDDGSLPTYESYLVGPQTVGAQSALYEFKPVSPPVNAEDPDSVVAREWLRGNLGEAAAIWNTEAIAPAISSTNPDDTSGVFEVKIEVFDESGNHVPEGSDSFRFLLQDPASSTVRYTNADEVIDGNFIMKVHVDNNHVASSLPQPDIDGVAASDECGFLRYDAGDNVRIRYHASHPNDHAVFRFGVKRGSIHLASASTLSPYVETASPIAPTPTGNYSQSSNYYQRHFAVSDLVGECVNAAFAAHLNVYGKATNGRERLGIHSGNLIAFALAETETES